MDPNHPNAYGRYPRPPTPGEFDSLFTVIADNQYGENFSPQEEMEFRAMLSEAADDGRFIITRCQSDSPGYSGPVAIVIWPSTAVSLYHNAPINLPSFGIEIGDWYECDTEGMVLSFNRSESPGP